MTGMSRVTGRPLPRAEHIRQSIADILTTPVGSRIMRREYGSLLPELIDQPGNPTTKLLLMAATVGAIMTWEPRVTIESVSVDITAAGTVTVSLCAVDRDDYQPLQLNGIEVFV